MKWIPLGILIITISLNYDIVVTLSTLTLRFFLDQARALIISQFQEEDHPFIRKALQDEYIHVVSFYYVYKPKTNTPM